jgi:hypothetical protein
MTSGAQSRDDISIGGGPDQRDGQPCAPSQFTELQIAVSLFDRDVVSPFFNRGAFGKKLL